jgi:two-component system LytT family response regulator
MNTFGVLVVDDEPLAREVLVNLLRRDGEVSRVTETGDPRPVPALVANEHPDILFLDIEMPGLDGLQIASAVTSDLPVVVFVTAFDRYAVDAFEVDAIDYLLKPFSDRRFFQALDRAKQRVRERRMAGSSATAATQIEPGSGATSDQAFEPPQAYLRQIEIGHGADATAVSVADIHWIQAEDYYVLIHSKRGRHLFRASMSSLEERLDPRVFLRAHRAALVNVRAVMSIEPDRTALTLSDGTRVPVSRSRRSQVERLLG